MTESSLTQDLLADLKLFRGWTVLKHCDRFTKGIPDLTVSHKIRTAWVEVKVMKSGEILQPRDFVDNQVQLKLCADLDGWFYVYHVRNKVCIFVQASEVLEAFRLGIEIEYVRLWHGKAFDQVAAKLRKELYG